MPRQRRAAIKTTPTSLTSRLLLLLVKIAGISEAAVSDHLSTRSDRSLTETTAVRDAAGRRFLLLRRVSLRSAVVAVHRLLTAAVRRRRRLQPVAREDFHGRRRCDIRQK